MAASSDTTAGAPQQIETAEPSQQPAVIARPVAIKPPASAESVAAAKKKHGRFVVYEGDTPYQGPEELSDAPPAPAADQLSPRAAAAGAGGLAPGTRFRSQSTPDLVAAAPSQHQQQAALPPLKPPLSGSSMAPRPPATADKASKPQGLPPAAPVRPQPAVSTSGAATAEPAAAGAKQPARATSPAPTAVTGPGAGSTPPTPPKVNFFGGKTSLVAPGLSKSDQENQLQCKDREFVERVKRLSIDTEEVGAGADQNAAIVAPAAADKPLASSKGRFKISQD